MRHSAPADSVLGHGPSVDAAGAHHLGGPADTLVTLLAATNGGLARVPLRHVIAYVRELRLVLESIPAAEPEGHERAGGSLLDALLESRATAPVFDAVDAAAGVWGREDDSRLALVAREVTERFIANLPQ
jgi:hypothetical protein